MLRKFAGEASDYARLPTATTAVDRARMCGLRCPHGQLVPDIDKWRAGDVVLSSAAGPLNPIVQFQKMLHGDAQPTLWTHVGIYDGTGYIWDASPGDHVQERAVGDFVLSKAAIALARYNGGAISPSGLMGVLREHAGFPYRLAGFQMRLLARLVGRIQAERTTGTAAEAVICTTFVERVFRHCAGAQLFAELPVVVPADIAVSRHFDPVEIVWQRC